MGVGMCQAELGPCSSVVNPTALLPQIVCARGLLPGDGIRVSAHALVKLCGCQ
jgi:hypothetical protein